MDLISIIQSVWRRKYFAIPVLVLTAALAIYTVKIKPPTYQATATMLLTFPPGQPTQTQIVKDPALKQASAYNTFVSYGDLRVVANTVMDLINSPASQAALGQAGVQPNYSLSLSSDYGNPPIIVITGVGKSEGAAITSASALAAMVKKDLYTVQQGEGVIPFYMIGTLEVVKPTVAEKASSGSLRSLISVFGVGIVLLFVVVSVADVIDKRRKAGISLTAGFQRVGGRRYPRNSNGDAPGPREYGSRLGVHESQYRDVGAHDDSQDGRRSVRDDTDVMRGEPGFHTGTPSWHPNDADRDQRVHDYRTTPGYPRDLRRGPFIRVDSGGVGK